MSSTTKTIHKNDADFNSIIAGNMMCRFPKYSYVRNQLNKQTKLVKSCNNCNKRYTPNSGFMKCGGCKITYYCSKKCQLENWKEHKKICKCIDNINQGNLNKNQKNTKKNDWKKRIEAAYIHIKNSKLNNNDTALRLPSLIWEFVNEDNENWILKSMNFDDFKNKLSKISLDEEGIKFHKEQLDLGASIYTWNGFCGIIQV
jgi:hypothetical protein